MYHYSVGFAHARSNKKVRGVVIITITNTRVQHRKINAKCHSVTPDEAYLYMCKSSQPNYTYMYTQVHVVTCSCKVKYFLESSISVHSG